MGVHVTYGSIIKTVKFFINYLHIFVLRAEVSRVLGVDVYFMVAKYFRALGVFFSLERSSNVYIILRKEDITQSKYYTLDDGVNYSP